VQGSATATTAWTSRVERGTAGALRFGTALYRGLGRRPFLVVLHAISLYFLVTGGKTRRASRAYLERVAAQPDAANALSRPPGARDLLHHLHEFSLQLFDRMCMWAGELDRFTFVHRGAEALQTLERAAAQGRGAIFLGSHYGSFDMLRSFAGKFRLPVNVVMYTANAPAINAFFANLGAESKLNVIGIEPGSPNASFEIRAHLERGEIVAILADRAGPADADRTVSVPFLGAPARLPRGPFEIALLLHCPVLAATGRRIGDATYEVSVEPFYDGAPVPRSERDRAVRMLAGAFAAHLEQLCRDDPYQWFNFYDYWQASEAGAEDAEAPAGGEKT
jgi:predicted LPLAT superfamily acyltransferase